MSLSHRDRLIKALNHEAPDRTPLAFGGINTVAYRALVRHLGFPDEELRVAKGVGSGGVVSGSEAVLRRFDIDVRSVAVGQPDGYPVELGPHSYRDQWGVAWRRSGPTAPHINVAGPLQHLDDPSPADLDAISWPDPLDPARFRGLRARAERIRQETDYGIVLGVGNAAFALAQRMRGFGQFFEDLLAAPEFAQALMERVTDVVCGFTEEALREIGGLVDIATFGDDMGTQRAPYMSPAMYRQMVKPHHRRLVESIRAHSGARIIMHSDGAIYDLIPDMIDAGVEGINPVQVSAAGMDPRRLKREFGGDLCFWGGIDTQHVLPYGSPQDVRTAARRT